MAILFILIVKDSMTVVVASSRLIDLLMMQIDIGPVFAIDFGVKDILFSILLIFQILLLPSTKPCLFDDF